jgi:hypothetical protein
MKSLRRAALALALVSAAGFTAAQAQAKSCNLNIEVQETNADGPPVEHASATATNVKTRRRFRAVAFEGMPVFGRLPAGRYSVTVSKRGYATAVKEVNLTCANLEPDDPSETEHVFLQKAGAAGAGGGGIGTGVGWGTGGGTTSSGIRDVDFLNYTYTASGCATDAGLPRTVKVVNGEFTNEESLFYNVRKDEIGYGDLNGDGVDEAVVQIRCGASAGTLRAFEVQAFTLRGGRPALLARLDSSQVERDYRKSYRGGTVFYPGQHAPKVERGLLIYEALTDGSFASPAYVATFRYRLSGSRFALAGKTTRAKMP